MRSILVTAKNLKEFNFIIGLLDKLRITTHELTVEEMEDIGMSILMKQANRTRKISREAIMKKLGS